MTPAVFLAGALLLATSAFAGERVDLYDAKGQRTGYATVHRENAPAVTDWIQLGVTLVLVLITAYYAWQNRRLAVATERANETVRTAAKEQRDVARIVIASTIQSGLRTIEYWRARDVHALAAWGAIPSAARLVPVTGRQAVEYARLFNVEAAAELASAIDSLEAAESALHIAQAGWDRANSQSQRFCGEVLALFESAEQSLKDVQQLLRPPPMPDDAKGV